MNLRQLRYLQGIAESGYNISRAAERLHTAQPGISRQIQLLEQELGVSLLLRRGNRIVGVTEAGGEVLEVAQRMLRDADNPDRIPLSLLALVDGQPAGTVNLIHNDDKTRPHLHPWLAALVVVPERRGQGIGSALVRALLQEARRLGCDELYLGTDIPGFYERLGAVIHEQLREDHWVMCVSLADS